MSCYYVFVGPGFPLPQLETATMAKIYGILNGELTTSKTCNRQSILDLIETNGFVWGVATAEGELLVVNKSEALARKWEDPWKTSDSYFVVKVYAGKRAAEAACEPVETESDHHPKLETATMTTTATNDLLTASRIAAAFVAQPDHADLFLANGSVVTSKRNGLGHRVEKIDGVWMWICLNNIRPGGVPFEGGNGSVEDYLLPA